MFFIQKFYYHMFITTFSYLCQNKAIQNKKELLTLNWYHDVDAKTQYCAWYSTLRVSHKPLGHHVIQRKKKLQKMINPFIYRNVFITSTIHSDANFRRIFSNTWIVNWYLIIYVKPYEIIGQCTSFWDTISLYYITSR